MKKVIEYVFTELCGIRLKPRTLQLPITGRCNSKCSTCNIWRQEKQHDISVDDLKEVLKDDYFSKVNSVGINGGEPFLHRNFIEIIETILTLPNVKNIYIISNGITSSLILEKLVKTKSLCDKYHCTLHLTISFDGIGTIYSKVRGLDVFENVVNTIKKVKRNQDKYCSTLTLGTTISKGNIYYLSEIKQYAKELDVDVNYHLAVPNRRIFVDEDDFSIFHQERELMLGREFFFGEFKYQDSYKKKLLYFQNYYLLNKGKRISACNYKKQDLTIDEDFNLYFCAKESYKIGNLITDPARKIINERESKLENKRITNKCDSCGHYITLPTIKGFILFIFELFKPAIWIVYKYYALLIK